MTHTPTLTSEQLEAFGRELDVIREQMIADLGQADVDYIRRIIKA
ncbi:MAG: acyl-CoA desaturase, partial [Mycobacterium sp.]|nr:acyl-CoA desaturase [Mycobacterium sp.]